MTTTAPAPEIIDGVTAYLRTFADQANATDSARHVEFGYQLSYNDTAGVTEAVRRLVREGHHVVFWAERWKSRTVVTFYPGDHHPERATFSYKLGRRVLVAYWQ